VGCCGAFPDRPEEAALPTARVDGVDLPHGSAGSGPRVLFCNGSGATPEGTRPLLEAVSRSADLRTRPQEGAGAAGTPGTPR